jgi:methanogenic corrinoid protein MtbC1
MIAPSLDDGLYQTYLRDLLAGHREGCRHAVERLLASQLPLLEFYEHLFAPSLHDVGRLWEAGQVSVSVEHLATAITEEMMGLVFPRVARGTRLGRRALVTCSPNEFHQVGGRMVADVLELRGWDVDFLGANVDDASLLGHLRALHPKLVLVSISVEQHIPRALECLKLIRSVDAAVPLMVGGRALLERGATDFEEIAGVTFARSLAQMEMLVGLMETR